MIIEFHEPIYETIWTLGVDRILSYDTKSLEFTVQNVDTGEIRKHMTNINAFYVSTSNIPLSRENRKYVINYMIKCGLPVRVISGREYI